MAMKVTTTSLPGVLILEPAVFHDKRGFFLESFSFKTFTKVTGVDALFVQDNHSRSGQGVLRGLHYQIRKAQGKLVRVIEGSVFDVAVDIRIESPTFGQWVGVELSADNKKQLWVPPDFAHGFLVLSEVAQVLYKSTDYYAPEYERSIRWDDPDIGIIWPELDSATILSQKDSMACGLAEAQLPRFL